jgi:hypothetical protein
MPEAAHVLAIEVLRDLQGDLRQFAGRAGEILIRVDREIQRSFEWLNDRERHWRKEVRLAEEGLWAARRALERCQDSDEDDCSQEEEAVYEARAGLRQAEENLATVRQWIDRARRAADRYDREAQRLQRLITEDTEKACGFLDRAYTSLQQYTAIPAGAGVAGAGGTSAAALATMAEVVTNAPFPIVSEATFDEQSVILGAIHDAGLETFLQSHPLQRLELLRDFDRPSHWMFGGAPGVYYLVKGRFGRGEAHAIAIKLTLAPRNYGQSFVPGQLWVVSYAGRDRHEAVKVNLAHELGHHVHNVVISALPDTDNMVKTAFRSAKANGRLISRYAGARPTDYFAECFAAYVYQRGALEAFDPDGFRMVREFRQMAGIE